MSARQGLSRLCYVDVMAAIPGVKHARAVLFPLLFLAIALMGILPAHQWTGFATGSNLASGHESHAAVFTEAHSPDHSDRAAAAHDAAFSADTSGDDSGDGDPIPGCHSADNPLVTSPDRCTSRGSEPAHDAPDPDHGLASTLSWDRQRSACPALTRPSWRPHGADLLAVVCVLRT